MAVQTDRRTDKKTQQQTDVAPVQEEIVYISNVDDAFANVVSCVQDARTCFSACTRLRELTPRVLGALGRV